MSDIFEKYSKSVQTLTPVCNTCKHHTYAKKCSAFKVIPDEIVLGINDHSKPLPNQENKIVYEQIKPTKNESDGSSTKNV